MEPYHNLHRLMYIKRKTNEKSTYKNFKGGNKMIKKKVISLTLVGCMLFSGLPIKAAEVSAVGGTQVRGNVVTEPTDKALESIIKAVKAKVSIPKEMTKFDYYYNSQNAYSKAFWYLTWNNDDYSQSISVSVDQDENIIGYNFNENRNVRFTPKYLKSDLQGTALDFIKKMAPQIVDKIEFLEAESNGYSGQYSYTFRRVENKIPMPDNAVTVNVNYETGKVTSYDLNWLFDVKVPSGDVKISEKEAAEKLGKKVAMKLTYQNAYETDENGNTTIKAFLVYSPELSYASVDAKTGEVYTTQNEWVNKSDTTKEAAAKDDSGNGSELSSEEIKKIQDLKDIISKDKAIKTVTDNSSLLLDKNLKSITARLYKYRDYHYLTKNKEAEERYVWNINFSDPREVNEKGKDVYRPYAIATVDAKTGKLISFNASVKDSYHYGLEGNAIPKINYSKKQGQTILENFLKDQVPTLFKNTVLTTNDGSYVIGYKGEKEIYGGYYYNYERTHEKISYPYNAIYGAVDGVTGKIYNFSYNWDESVEFESPKNIISAQKAYEYYVSNDAFGLVYEINNIHSNNDKVKIQDSADSYSIKSEIRLVYRNDLSPAYISPFTGKQLDNEGKEYVKNAGKYSYSDIKGHKSEKNILLLAELGIGFEGGKFSPDQAITNKELNEFLNKLNYYHEKQYELKNNSSNMSRVEAAKFVVQILGYDKIAQLKGIYSATFVDQNQISQSNAGYAAIAYGFGLITANDRNEFRPNENLTRAEAADMILTLLSVK